MRRRILGIAIAIAALLVHLGAVPALAATDRILPNAIAFWNSEHGLTGGGYPYFNSPGKISMTTDGGRAFRTVLKTDGGVVWLDTAGTEDAWAVVQANSEDRYLLHTGDGGITWHQVLPYVRTETPGFGSPLIGLAVTTGSYAPAGGTRFIATSDGGATWKRRSSPCPKKKTETALATLASPERAWAVCGLEAGTGAQAKMIYRSTDGGRHWDRLVNVKFGGCDAGMCSLGYLSGLSFARGFGFMWQEGEWGYLTRSGGKHWKLARDAGLVGSASIVSERQGFVLEYRRHGPSLLETEDAGLTWTGVHHWRRGHSD